MSNLTPVVDVHSHIYPPTWISLLQSRTTPPYIDTIANTLVNRPGVTGKPLLPNLHDISTKIDFMNKHGIDISVLSLGNPWLDFLVADDEKQEAGKIAQKINQEMEDMCRNNEGRLYFFAVLPMTVTLNTILQHIRALSLHPHCRGAVLGYSGFGNGLDDPSFFPVLSAIAESSFPIFFHPNYGLPGDVFGPCCGQHGQVLPVSLGFTTETTIAFTRMYLAEIFVNLPGLQIILPHAGGTLPFVIGRIEACIANDKAWSTRLASDQPRKSLEHILKHNIYLDGITFDRAALRAAADAVGSDRLMFGTDHPLFPSLRKDGMYDAMIKNKQAAEECFGLDSDDNRKVMGGNAARILRLKL